MFNCWEDVRAFVALSKEWGQAGRQIVLVRTTRVPVPFFTDTLRDDGHSVTYIGTGEPKPYPGLWEVGSREYRIGLAYWMANDGPIDVCYGPTPQVLEWGKKNGF